MKRYYYLKAIQTFRLADESDIQGLLQAFAGTHLASGIQLTSTDPKILDWLYNSLSASTALKVEEVRHFHSGEKYQISVAVPIAQLDQVWIWLIKTLCFNGWEPFSTHQITEPESGMYFIHFRREEEE
ncbi:MAG: hypothetical protein L0332_35965 [Chloroflexi bacterium]|nr:hypothetical protein [Chloroflexota bacterium]MCI0649183.1 hypothetical protein [Chloroflexota bacterium]MCI0732094.1 hypothetical protein [Chloroflexota bacterium]